MEKWRPLNPGPPDYTTALNHSATLSLLLIIRFSILVLILICHQMLRLKETCYQRTTKSQQKPVANWRHIWLKNSKYLPRLKARKCAKSCKRYISFCCLFVCLVRYFLAHLFSCLLVCLFVCLLVCSFARLLACLVICLFACLFVCFLTLLACFLVCLLVCFLACLLVS